jgi:hypothetical protein
MAAAGMLTQNIAAAQAAIAPAGQNPTPAAASAESQAAVRPQISASVLKASLSIEATTAAEMSQMISQGSGVNILA